MDCNDALEFASTTWVDHNQNCGVRKLVQGIEMQCICGKNVIKLGVFKENNWNTKYLRKTYYKMWCLQVKIIIKRVRSLNNETIDSTKKHTHNNIIWYYTNTWVSITMEFTTLYIT